MTEIIVLMVMVLAASACSLVGNFLVLRRLSLMGDAISHAVLPGIVLAFMVVGGLQSPMFFVFSVLFALVLAFLIQWFSDRMKISHESVIGIVFTSLFALGVILLVRYVGNVHLDQDAVLFGQVEFSAWNRFEVFGVDIGVRSLWMMGTVLLIDAAMLLLFWKELALSAFDSRFADSNGFSSRKLHYLLVLMTAITVVAAFEAVGGVLVVALIVVPSVTAYLVSGRLAEMVWKGQLFALLAALGGYFFAFWADVSMAGSVAMMSGVLLVLVVIARSIYLLFLRKRGV